MNKHTAILTLLVILILTSCSSGDKENAESKGDGALTFSIENLTDKEYPDNPDIGFRATNYQTTFFKKGKIDSTENFFVWDFTFLTKKLDTISLTNVNISEFIPTIPEHVKPDDYLSYISCINQEWNRNQVKFMEGEFHSDLSNIIRVDLARNCLNAYLWEVILYTEESGDVLPYAHGWFNFPQQQYAELFERKNNIPFKEFKEPLENWVDPPNKRVDLTLLRTIQDTISISYQDLSDEMYPLEGARKKKFKEIIHPDTFSTMRDLQSDSTLFATFSPPGIYNKQDPRKTELGRIHNLEKISMFQVLSKANGEILYEIQLIFSHKRSNEKTTLIIGGIDLNKIPVLTESEANNGWKSSMGIGNHTFYETYDEHIKTSSKKSPYYALILGNKGKWLDSHKVGIDGPLFHFTDTQKKNLHLWILSFERHAFVGHYGVIIE